MKKAVLVVVVVVVAAVIAVAAQNRGSGPGGAGRPGSRIAFALDADHDGIISSAEMTSAAAALKSLDANGDGRLTAVELRPAFGPDGRRQGESFGGRPGRGEEGGERGGPSAASPDELTDTLMAADRNADGRLERTEVPERFQGLFDRSDANRDGALTREEIKQTATASMQNDGGREGRGQGGRRRGGMMFDPLLRALDTDSDGALSDAEIAGGAAALEPLDANQDGQLSAEELRPAPGRGREGREAREERDRGRR